MTLPPPDRLRQVIAATWPPMATQTLGPITLRRGDNGGSRVSSTTADAPIDAAAVSEAEAIMQSWGQPALFQIREGDAALDEMLAAAGYAKQDTTLFFAGPIAPLTETPPPHMTCFEVWPPLAAQRDIWTDGGITAGRQAVMERAQSPKTTIMGRINDRPAATAYVGCDSDCIMIHALEVAARDRRQGLAAHVTRAAAIWGQRQGALWLTLVTTQANSAARALYTSLGLSVVGQYHYRIKPDD